MILHALCVFIYSYPVSKVFLYLGPGMDGGTISMIIAFLISFLSFLISIIWYPIKKAIHFFKNLFGKTTPASTQDKDISDNSL